MDIGIVGMGGMGRVYAKNLAAIPDAHLTAVASSDPNAGEEFGARVYAGLEDMLGHERLDVCCVCTPTFLHYDNISAALDAGVNVIAEKPLALTEKEAAALYKKAERNGVRLFVAQVVRFAYPNRVLKEFVDSGRFGRVTSAYFGRLSMRPYWSRDNWVFYADKSGHVPFDLHIHDLDYIVSLFGIPKASRVKGSGNADKPYYEHLRFTYDYDGLQVTAEAAWFDLQFPFTVEWRVCFETAVAQCSSDVVTLFTKEGPPQIFEPARENAVATGINVPATDMYRDELTHFLTCIRNGTPSDVVSEADVVAVIGILEKLMAQGGCPT